MKKALLYIVGSTAVGIYWFAWDQILPDIARQIQAKGDIYSLAQFWLILSFPLWFSLIAAIFLWIMRQLDK